MALSPPNVVITMGPGGGGGGGSGPSGPSVGTGMGPAPDPLTRLQAATVAGVERILSRNVGPSIKLRVHGYIRSDLVDGEIGIRVEMPPDTGAGVSPAGTYEPETTMTINPARVKQLWQNGDRDGETTIPAYALGWIEPHVTWASDLGWRVTPLGKKAGLK